MKNLKGKYTFEAVEFETYSKVDTTDSILSISIVNMKNLFTSTEDWVNYQLTYSKDIANRIKHELKDPNRYQKYVVAFIHRDGSCFWQAESFYVAEIFSKDL